MFTTGMTKFNGLLAVMVFLAGSALAQPIASFTADPTTGEAPITVTFTNTSQNAYGVYWSFGDGNSSNDWSPTHTFEYGGTYSVSLQVWDDYYVDYYYMDLTFTGTPPPMPVANFTADPASGEAPVTVTFTNLSENTDYVYWDFGDGSGWYTDWNPTHTFEYAGTYTVYLEAWNNWGYNSYSMDLTFTGTPPPYPVASFTADPITGEAPITVTFTNTSQNGDSAYWDFGDGNYSYDINTTHTFEYGGTYTVYLEVWNNWGYDSYTMDLTFTGTPIPYPVANFSADPITGDAPITVTFANLSENTDYVYWNFGDGSDWNTD